MFCVASRSAGCGGRTLSRRTVRKMSRGRRFPPCAGKVLSLPGCWRVASRLPRPRGELHLEGPRRVVDRGWSPRARGSRRPPADEARRVGFIPASAGATPRSVAWSALGRVHRCPSGSPAVRVFRETPLRLPSVSGVAGVHPPACGASAAPDGQTSRRRGTSPRARGNPRAHTRVCGQPVVRDRRHREDRGPFTRARGL